MLAIIGGTGIYQIEGVEVIDKIQVETPFGEPSAPISRLRFKDKEFLFLPRHGENHQFLPHEINYRANIFALKKIGAKQILGFSAVGSLREDIHPGQLAIPDQYFDWIKGNREKTFFGNGLAAHVSTAQPTCPDLTNWVYDCAKKMNFPIHKNKTYACVDGPRLGTKAESNFLRSARCDLVGMTNVPEVFLAREAQICYAVVGIVTDYDCWMEDPQKHATVSLVISRYSESLQKIKLLLLNLLELPFPKTNEEYRKSLEGAILTPQSKISEENLELLKILKR